MTSLYFQISAFSVIILLLYVFFSKERIKNKETKTYSTLLILTFFALIVDISIVLIGYNYELKGIIVVILTILNKVYFTILLFWVSTFALYMIYISLINQQNKYFKIEKVINIISLISIFIICILPVSLYKEEGVMFSYGLSVNYLVFILVIYNLLLTFYTLRNLSGFKIKKYLPLFSLIALLFLVVIVNKINPGILLTTAVATYVVLIMYFTIENPDVKMIQALNEAKMAAEKANRAKSDFLSNMSHEIRTPLNAIVGFSDCILEEEKLEEAKNDAKDIKLASENLLEIVNGILDISKIEANKMEIINTDYNPIEEFEIVAKLVKPRITEKPIELITNFAPDIPNVLHGDNGKIRQIITNILTNAAKYTEKGTIKFDVSCINEEKISNLIISVEDTGRGIKPEQIDKLFTKFERLEEDKNTTLEGTGLGLAITKRFVEMLGGKIIVQSKYGEGSKFTVFIKQQIVSLEKTEANLVADFEKINKSNKKNNYSSAKVLIVDDNKINLKVALKLLSNFGINADTAESGFVCLEKINENNKYDLILLDDMMPKMSGVETLKKLKEIDNFNIPVVALTANAVSGMKEKYLNDGFDDYISKPIDKNELERILKEYL